MEPAAGRIHELAATSETLHGSFSTERRPALSVKSGDTVRFATLDIGWGLEPPDDKGERPRHEAAVPGIALVGPVEVVGAEPGMVLAIDILDVRPGPWGFTFAGSGLARLDQRLELDGEALLRWELDADKLVGRSELGHTIDLRPFPGTIGMPADAPGEQSPWPPRRTGGNMDCAELVAGTTLFLPIEVAGGLLSVGDGHARQGHGEVAGMAIECPLARLELRLVLRDDLALRGPRVRTSNEWIAMGFGESLDEATADAVNGLLDVVVEAHGVSRSTALALATAVVDLRVTQAANPLVGVHAVLRDDAIR
jgi:acetamidase/formamidase